MAEPRNRYSTVSLALHWIIALGVLAQVLLITAHEKTEGVLSGQFVMLHKSVGITILVLTLARIGWRRATCRAGKGRRRVRPMCCSMSS